MPRECPPAFLSTPASDSFTRAMICSSLNRLFRTTPPFDPGRVTKWRSHIFDGLISGGQVSAIPHHIVAYANHGILRSCASAFPLRYRMV
jgi:hypothetical protein